MAEPTSCCVPGSYCGCVDTLFICRALHVLDVTWREPSTTLPGRLRLVVESELAETDCPSGGVICTTLRGESVDAFIDSARGR